MNYSIMDKSRMKDYPKEKKKSKKCYSFFVMDWHIPPPPHPGKFEYSF